MMFNYPGCGGDDNIKELIVKSSRIDISGCECPNLQYGKIASFANTHEASIEYFANYSGMRFYFGINELAYCVYVKTLDASKKNNSGISISAQVIDLVDADEPLIDLEDYS